MKTLTFFVAAILATILPCYARSSKQGFCEQGNRTISVNTVTSSTATPVQRSFPSCTVTVYLNGTVTLASLYADNSGTPKANPFVASGAGLWFFYVDDGAYDIQFSGGGISPTFSIGGVPALDPTLFNTIRLMGDSHDYATIAAAYAAAPSTGAWIVVGPGSYVEPAAINLSQYKPIHLSCMGQGKFDSSQAQGITTVDFSASGYLFNLASGSILDGVTIDNCAFEIHGSATGWMKIGAFSEGRTNYRYGWAFTNVTVSGPGAGSSTTGMAVTDLVGLTLTNFSIQLFGQTAIFDRNAIINGNHVRFAYYKDGPLFTQQGGSGQVGFAAISVLTNAEFLGPYSGSNGYCVTVDQLDLQFINAIYEPGVVPQAMIHITAQGRNFRDYGGFFSYFTPIVPNYLMVWDDQYTEMTFLGTMWTGGNAAEPICIGVPGVCAGTKASGFGSTPVCIGCSASIYSSFVALGSNLALAIGGPPAAYGAYTAITGPLWVDTTASGETLKGTLNKNGQVGDVQRIILPMPASTDRTKLAPIGLEAVTEAVTSNTVRAGFGLRSGTDAASFYGLYCNGYMNNPQANCIIQGNLTFNGNQGHVDGRRGAQLTADVVPPNTNITGEVGDMYVCIACSSGQILWLKGSGTGMTGWEPVTTH